VRAALFALLLAACAPPVEEPPGLPQPRIASADAPSPILAGTLIRVTGTSFDRLGGAPVLEVASAAGTVTLSSVLHDAPDELLFALDATSFARLVPGGAPSATLDVELVVEGAGLRTDPFLATWELARDLPLALGEGLRGDVHWNDVVVLDGEGFVAAGEGTLEAHVVGTFTPSPGAPIAVDARVPLSLVDRTSRTRAVIVLGTELGRNTLGRLEGTIAIESTLLGGAPRITPTEAVSLRFLGPELYAFDPASAAPGQTVRLRGAGFLGGRSGATLIRVEGTFTPDGGVARPFSEELVPELESGSTLRLTLDTRVEGERLVAELFDAARGALEAVATPITIAGTDELTGVPVPFRFVLEGPRQVVWLRFLPGYYDSLARFGLLAAASRIEDGIIARVEAIYAGYRVELRTEEPSDFDVNHHAIVEIGGPDPNGNGLFGYDNSPGKDVGNLRLFDRIGGLNAMTQMDGAPGYGGVFVQSLLWWSAHPELPGERPPSSPAADPLFDAIFDPVRRTPVTLAETRGEGEPARVAAVERAIRALAAIIGETTAHELGHSFGLAQPYGERNVFHNDADGEGCLMDRGGDRPLAERAEEPDAAVTTLCYDEPAYLAEILGD
jgi:hypothetical protein